MQIGRMQHSEPNEQQEKDTEAIEGKKKKMVESKKIKHKLVTTNSQRFQDMTYKQLLTKHLITHLNPKL